MPITIGRAGLALAIAMVVTGIVHALRLNAVDRNV
jgi:hypothetical protein